MWFSDRGYPCHFPEGWRVNDLNPKELKPFASGAGPRFATKKLSLRGMHPLGVSPNKKTDWWIDSDDFFLVDIGEFGKKHDITENFTYGGDQLGARVSQQHHQGIGCVKKMEPFCFWKGDDLGALIEGKARRSVCVCVFFLVWCCYVMLSYVMCFCWLYLLHLVRFIIIVMIIIPILVPPGSLV